MGYRASYHRFIPVARPKKTELSPLVGTAGAGRKRGNADFVGSSFYVPRLVNNRFNRALLLLKDAGFDLDRSDILSVLMDRFSAAVEQQAAQPTDEETGSSYLEQILAAAGDQALDDTAQVSGLLKQMRDSIAEVKQAGDGNVERAQQLLSDVAQLRSDLEAERAEVQAERMRLRALGVDTNFRVSNQHSVLVSPSDPSPPDPEQASPPDPAAAAVLPQD